MTVAEIQAQVLDGIIEPEILTAKEIQETFERFRREFFRENVVEEAPSFDIVEIPKPVIQPTVDTNTVRQVQDTVRRKFMNGSIGFDARAGEDVSSLDNGDWFPVRGHRMTAADQALMDWKIEPPHYDLREYVAKADEWPAADYFYRIPHECAVSARDIFDALKRVNAEACTSIQFQNGQTMVVVNRDETGAFDALANSLSRGGTLADFISEQKESEQNLDEFFDEFPEVSEVDEE